MNLESSIAKLLKQNKQILELLGQRELNAQWVKAAKVKKELQISRGKLQSIVKSYPNLKRPTDGHPEYNLTALKQVA